MTATCAHCGKHKPGPKKPQAGVDPMHYQRDPFCSRKCCEAAHGITGHPGDAEDSLYHGQAGLVRNRRHYT